MVPEGFNKKYINNNRFVTLTNKYEWIIPVSEKNICIKNT